MKFLPLVTLSLMAVSGAALAANVTPGAYEFAVGHAAPCAATLGADGKATVDASCKATFSQWKTTPSGIELLNGAGDVYAALNAKDGGYAGAAVSDNHTIVLSPASKTAGLAH